MRPFAFPCTMILIDPELESTGRQSAAARGRPGAVATNRTQGRTPSPASRNDHLPAARTLAGFLRRAQEAVRLRGEVTVFLTTDRAIRKLNRGFRGQNKPTDVLSFPAGGPSAEALAGDLAISVHTALRQASEQGHALGVEIKVLVLHGLLHLAGYDHETDDGRMARRERTLRARLGLPQGLIERASAKGTVRKPATRNGARGVRA